jgi:hypothetical protein
METQEPLSFQFSFFDIKLFLIFMLSFLVGCTGANQSFVLTSDMDLTGGGQPQIEPSIKTMSVNNEFSFAASKGQFPYNFKITNGNGRVDALTGKFTAGTQPGTVVLTLTDANGLTSTATIIVTSALKLDDTEVILEKGANYTFTPQGGVPPYSYSMLSGKGAIDSITGDFTAAMTSGSSAIQIRDSFGNAVVKVVTVTDGVVINPSSATIKKGTQQTFSAYGGIGPYTYSLKSGSAGTINATTGVYVAPSSEGTAIAVVTDHLGHTMEASITITNDLSFNVGNVIMSINNSIDLSTYIDGGTAPFTFTVNAGEGSVTNAVYSSPSLPGIYTISLTDSAAQPHHATLKVIVNSELVLLPLNFQVSVDGTKKLTPLGGVTPYTYTVLTGGGSVSPAGIYTAPAESGSAIIQIKDARNNTATSNVVIGESLIISPLTQNVINGESLNLTATGGIAPYTYSIVSGKGSINPRSGVYVAPVYSGIETVRVEDSVGNRSDATLTIISKLSIGSNAYLLKGGTKQFSAIAGTAPYVYSIKSGVGTIDQNTGVYSAPSSEGDAVIKVVDAVNATHEVNLKVYDFLSITPLTQIIAKNQTLTFSAAGGVPPYTYTLLSGVGNLSTNGSFLSSASGTSVVRVTDAINNTMDANVTVNTNLSIIPNQLSTQTNKKSTFVVSGGVSPYVFSVKSGGGTIDPSTGEYTAPANVGSAVVKVMDATDASDEAVITISESLTLTPMNPTIASGDAVEFAVSGGTAPYKFSIVMGGGSFSGTTFTSPSVYSGGTSTIRVSDATGKSITTKINYTAVQVAITSPTMFDYINSVNASQFVISGTCTELARTVSLIISGGYTANPTCQFGSFTTTLDLSSLPDGPVSITADHNSSLGITAQTSMVLFNKDIVLPTADITTPEAQALVINEVEVTGNCTKRGLVNISAGAGVTAVANCNGAAYSAILNVSAADQGALEISVTHIDGKGNTTAEPAKLTIIHDSVPPVVSQLTVTNSRYTSSNIYDLIFTETGDSTEFCILENINLVEKCMWNPLPLPVSMQVDYTNNDKVLSAWVRDAAGNISAKVDSNTVTLNTTMPSRPSISLYNPQTSPNNNINPIYSVTSLNLLSGDSVKIYTDASCMANLKGTSSTYLQSGMINVQSDSLSQGTYVFYAQTTNNAGTKSACSAGTPSYTVDLTAPSVSSVTGSGSGPSTPVYLKSGGTLTISIQFSEAVYVTGSPVLALATGRTGAQATYSSGSGTNTLVFDYTVANTDNSSDLSYAATNSLSLNSGTIRDFAGNDSELNLPAIDASGSLSANQQIVIDTTAPVAASSIVDGVWLNSATSSPGITFTAATDSSGSGIAKQQIQVIRASDSVVMQTWIDLSASATSYTVTSIGTSLSDTIMYKVQFKAIDKAGNASSVVTSDGWTVDLAAPVAPLTLSFGSVPNSLTNSPALTWSTNGTDGTAGVSSYNVNVYSGASLIKSITGFAKGGALTGLTLTNGSTYSAKVMSVDAAGNVGPESVAASWTTSATTSIALASGTGSGMNITGTAATSYGNWVNFVYTNSGGAPSSALSVALASTTNFELWTNTTLDPNSSAYTGCSGISLGAGASCSVYVRPKATDSGTLTSSTLNLTCTSGCPSGVALSGTASGFIFNVSVNGGTNLTINNSWLSGQGWNGAWSVNISNTGNFNSSTTSTAALTLSVTMPAGKILTFTNCGSCYIVGRGGNGGAGNLNSGSAGGAGGTGLSVTSAVTFVNNGVIAGGGGGGGGGAGWHGAGGGGGGGAGGGSAGAGGTGIRSYQGGYGYDGSSGSSGSTTSAGSGGRGGDASIANGGQRTSATYGNSGSGTGAGSGGAPGNVYNNGMPGGGGGGGGGLGSAGGAGGTNTYRYSGSGPGGAAGSCTSGNGYITWSATGTRYGSLN